MMSAKVVGIVPSALRDGGTGGGAEDVCGGWCCCVFPRDAERVWWAEVEVDGLGGAPLLDAAALLVVRLSGPCETDWA